MWRDLGTQALQDLVETRTRVFSCWQGQVKPISVPKAALLSPHPFPAYHSLPGPLDHSDPKEGHHSCLLPSCPAEPGPEPVVTG